MKILFFHLDHLPYPTGVGVPVAMWALTLCLLERGHKVLAVTASRDEESDSRHSRAESMLKEIGVESCFLPELPEAPVPNLLRKAFNPRLSDLYDAARNADSLKKVLKAERPDALIVYHENSILTAHAVGSLPPTMGIQVNIDTLKHRVRTFPPKNWKDRIRAELEILADSHRYRRLAAAMAEEAAPVCLAASTKDWLAAHGVRHIEYFPIPIKDPAPDGWRELKDAAQQSLPVAKILMVGELRGTPTRLGLKFFAEEILPHLDESIGKGRYEVHVCGPGSLPGAIEQALQHPAVQIRGFVPDIRQEFLSATLLLTPTPVAVGARTRVAEGFGFGCCIVAHQAEAAGMPEMVHNQTCLMAASGREIAELCGQALKDRELRRRIEAGARLCFEESYSSRVAGRRLADHLEKAIPHAARLSGAAIAGV